VACSPPPPSALRCGTANGLVPSDAPDARANIVEKFVAGEGAPPAAPPPKADHRLGTVGVPGALGAAGVAPKVEAKGFAAGASGAASPKSPPADVFERSSGEAGAASACSVPRSAAPPSANRLLGADAEGATAAPNGDAGAPPVCLVDPEAGPPPPEGEAPKGFPSLAPKGEGGAAGAAVRAAPSPAPPSLNGARARAPGVAECGAAGNAARSGAGAWKKRQAFPFWHEPSVPSQNRHGGVARPPPAPAPSPPPQPPAPPAPASSSAAPRRRLLGSAASPAASSPGRAHAGAFAASGGPGEAPPP
jgi:hypothetical protein